MTVLMQEAMMVACKEQIMMASSPLAKKSRQEEEDATEDPAVTLFREYLRIPTISRGEDYLKHYAEAVRFLQKQADDIGLPCELVEVAPGHNVVLMTLEGTSPELKSVMLNSHYDVVPVFPEHWRVDPFSAHKYENGDIYARGTQDMKCVTLWQLEAMRRLKEQGCQFPRTIYLTMVPDEEIGGKLGMEVFVKTERFQKMNVGFELDEGLANPTDAMTVFLGERSPYWITITCPGNPGHGSRFIENTAVEKVVGEKILSAALAYRTEQESKLKSNPNLKLGDVTTLNVTKLEGGVQHNVVPEKMKLGVDMRLSPHDDHDAIMKMVEEWVEEAGEGCSFSILQTDPTLPMTSVDPSDIWWKAFSTACERKGVQLEPEIFPASTDSRFLRILGIPCLGFSPMNHTPILLHDHNEFLNERVFLDGIAIYKDVISAVASVEPF